MAFMPGWGAPDTGGGVFGGIFGGANMPAIAIAFSSGLKAFGQISSGNALVTAAKRRQQAAELEAQQAEINANQALAHSQRQAYFEGLKGEELMSAIRARAGAGASDPGVLNIIANAMERASYNVQASLYGGKDKARNLRMVAAAKRFDAARGMADAKAGQRASRFAAIGSIAEGVSSLYQRYWAPEKVSSSMSRSMIGPKEYELDAGEMWDR